MTANSSSLIDVILTNRKRSFKNSSAVATGVSDFHKMVLTTMRANYECLKPIQIQYRSYKYFRKDIFLRDLGVMPFHKCRDITNKDAAYDLFKQMFFTVVDKHAPLKKKLIRGTQAPFMNKELNKAIMYRSKLRNIIKRRPLKLGKLLRDREINVYPSGVKTFEAISPKLLKKSGTNSTAFWTALKPFLSSKHLPKSHKIILNENEKKIDDSISVTNIMNDYERKWGKNR